MFVLVSSNLNICKLFVKQLLQTYNASGPHIFIREFIDLHE